MAVVLPIPPTGTPYINPLTGAVNEVWQRYLISLEDALSGDVAPVDAQYWVSTANTQLTNDRNIGALSTGYLKITTAAGIATPSTVTAIPGTDISGVVAVLHGGTGADLSGTGGTSRVVQQLTAGGAFTVAQLTTSDISGLASSTYTPTASATVNLDAGPTMTLAQYLRVGSVVSVSGAFTANPTAAGAASFELTLPVASNIGATSDVAGVAFSGAISGQGAAVTGVIANDTAKMQWVAVDVTSQPWSYSYTYRII